MKGKKTIFFTPHSAIWLHTFPESLVAEALKDSSTVQMYTCDRIFSDYCVSMSAAQLPFDSSPERREAICRECRKKAAMLRKSFGFSGGDLGEYLDDGDRLQAQKWLAQVNPGNVIDFEIEGIAVGKKSLYEVLIHFKKQSIELSDNEWRRCRTALKNSILTYLAAKKILSRERPDAVVVYNSLYSVTGVFCEVAKSYGATPYFLHAGASIAHNYEEIYIGKEDSWRLWANMKKSWARFESVTCGENDLKKVTDHFVSLLGARTVFVYSSAKSAEGVDVRKKFGIASDQKIFVAALSSTDEQFAAEVVGVAPTEYRTLFRTQQDWVRFLIAEFRKRPEYFLLIRVHPREFPNRREGLLSEQGKRWKETLIDLPPNVKVNWPEDSISIYDLAEDTDVFLNGWSSVGKEMSLLGLPVVIYSEDLVNYPHDLNFLARSEAEYLRHLDSAVGKGWDFETIRKAYRWSALELVRTATDLSDAYPLRPAWRYGPIERIIRKILRRVYPRFQERYDLWKRPKKIRNGEIFNKVVSTRSESVLDFPETYSAAASFESETALLRRELSRIVAALGGPNSGGKLVKSLHEASINPRK